MLDLLSTLWPFVLLLSVPYLANLIVLTIYRRVQSTHDWAIADDLPQTAGEWVRERAAVLGVEVIVTDQTAATYTNAFHIRHKTIQLTDDVHFKPDPVFWATAAHELGHAHLHVWHPRYARAKQIAGWLSRVLLMIGLALGLGNVLLGLPGVTALAFGVLLAALVAASFEVLEEALASLFAYRELRRSAHLTPRHLAAVRHVLVVAFSSYFVYWLSYALLLSQWHRIEELGSGPLVETSSLTTLGWISAIAITVFGVFIAVLRMTIVLKAPAVALRSYAVPDGLSVLWSVSLLALIWLVWDIDASPSWAWIVMVAIIPIAHLSSLAVAPVALPLVLARRFARRFSGRGIDRTARFLHERARGASLVKDGNATIAGIKIANEVTTTFGMRAFELINLAYVPLLVALWWL